MEMLVIAVIAIVAFALVLIPLFRRRPPSITDEREFDTGSRDDAPPEPPAARDHPDAPAPQEIAAGQEDRIELEVRRYRVALRSGTVCRKCGQANPAASVFCFECGHRLPRADAREFE